MATVRMPCDGGILKNRHEDLTYWGSDVIKVQNFVELELLLNCRGPIFDHERIVFAESDKGTPAGAGSGFSATDAIDRLVAARVLPAPTLPLPGIGARVEAMELGGKPPPACRYGVGVVRALEWDSYFREWRGEAAYDRRTGGWDGYPILGTSAFWWQVHVNGSDEMPFSEMTPDKIEALYQVRRLLYSRDIDPDFGLSDPSGIVPPRE